MSATAQEYIQSILQSLARVNDDDIDQDVIDEYGPTLQRIDDELDEMITYAFKDEK